MEWYQRSVKWIVAFSSNMDSFKRLPQHHCCCYHQSHLYMHFMLPFKSRDEYVHKHNILHFCLLPDSIAGTLSVPSGTRHTADNVSLRNNHQQ